MRTAEIKKRYARAGSRRLVRGRAWWCIFQGGGGVARDRVLRRNAAHLIISIVFQASGPRARVGAYCSENYLFSPILGDARDRVLRSKSLARARDTAPETHARRRVLVAKLNICRLFITRGMTHMTQMTHFA